MTTHKKEDRKARVLKSVALFQEDHGYPPSYRDLAEMLGVAHSLVHGYVKALRADGLIDERPSQTSRAITLTDAGYAVFDGRVTTQTTTD